MAPDLGGAGEGLPTLGNGVRVHRVWAGPVRGVLDWLERRRPSTPLQAGPRPQSPAGGEHQHRPAPPPRLNWKGRLLQRCFSLVAWAVFPDVRGEWRFPAKRALGRLLKALEPDVVVSSHEPATTLELGLLAKRQGYRWVADVADPVLAPYTPRRWQRRARSLESKVVRESGHLLVTAPPALVLLQQRHGPCRSASVVSQGFDDRLSVGDRLPGGADSELNLLYAGSFYSFRDPRDLVDAVLQVEGVRLTIASGNVPDWLCERAATCPHRIILLGSVPHRRLLSLQRQTDVLVNLANADACQIPGKFYEYFGAGRPILHLSAEEQDASGDLLLQLRRGWTCISRRADIVAILRSLVAAHRNAQLETGLDLTMEQVGAWSWTAAARRVESAMLASIRQDCESRCRRQTGSAPVR